MSAAAIYSTKSAYPKDMRYMLNLINDLAELLKGKFTVTDAEHGRLGFVVEFYGQKYEYLFLVSSDGKGGAIVHIETIPSDSTAQCRINRMFTLIDGFMP